MDLSLEDRLSINNLIESFQKKPVKSTATELWELVPLSPPGDQKLVSRTYTSKSGGLTDLGEFKEEDKIAKYKGESKRWRCGGYKVRKTKQGIIIHRFNDISAEGHRLYEVSDGDVDSLVITAHKGVVDSWGYYIAKVTERRINLFLLKVIKRKAVFYFSPRDWCDE